jgi:hypothetical protein
MPRRPITDIPHQFYGYEMTQNPSNTNFVLYVGAPNAEELRHLVSVDNAVTWDSASGNWCKGGRNRTIVESHWKSIHEFLVSSHDERILPNSIIISVAEEGFNFEPFSGHSVKHRTRPGYITLNGRYHTDLSTGKQTPVDEKDRYAWVLDGQHRIKAFREWAMPDPYPVNVVIIKKWNNIGYEDSMRHQTYELNMGRPLDANFKASIRERYDSQVGHPEYKREIALSWIRADIERRGEVFSPDGIVGGANLRTPFRLQMHTIENLIKEAYSLDDNLQNICSDLDDVSKRQSKDIGEYLFNFFEGVRLSIGKIHPSHYASIGTGHAGIGACKDYWELAKLSAEMARKQKLVHNVGLRAIVNGLLVEVMSAPTPSTPQDVAKKLKHMEGIPWYDGFLLQKKDDWVLPLAAALKKMYNGKGVNKKGGVYKCQVEKRSKDGTKADFTMTCIK